MSSTENNILTVAYINVHGQSKMSEAKQVQIEDFIKFNKVDIAHFQEIEICDETFSTCNLISSSFDIYSNNAPNKYGTASLVKSVFQVENMRCDTAGRALFFEIGGLTLGNLYAHSGTDAPSRANREHFYSEVVPQLLTSRRNTGCVGGDLNCIISKDDATNHQDSKMSSSLKRVTKVFDMKDSFRSLYPKAKAFSRYYGDNRGQGATRIDRQYHFGNINIIEAKYLPLSFSDHQGLVVKICLPDPISKIICPAERPSFRLKNDVIYDSIFQESLEGAFVDWLNIKAFGMKTLPWWELVVKPGIRRLGMQRGKQMARECRAELNLLLVRQAYLNKKVKLGHAEKLTELITVHGLIQKWYQTQCEKIKTQSRASEF